METLRLTDVRQNNLRGFDLEIRHDRLTCVTGVSGSGKSSLVFDTLFREAQRRYFESVSSLARHTLAKLGSPAIEGAQGLRPPIAVGQGSVVRNPRSTVGTLAELYDLLRLLFARCAAATEDGAPLTRSLFSFNSPVGWCPTCSGLGVEDQIDPDLLVADASRSLRGGALKITKPNGYTIYSQVTIDVLDQVCRSEGFDVETPWQELTADQRRVVLWGSDKIRIPYGKHPLESRLRWTGIKAKPREEGHYKGILPVMENILRTKRNPGILRFARTAACESCDGRRLNPRALAARYRGRSIAEYVALTVEQLVVELVADERTAAEICTAVAARCETIRRLGLGHLTLDRPSTTLSAGEAQRLKLATQLGTGLRGVLYVLDEPSIGLHPADTQRLIALMRELRDQGNTVVVVEHDLEIVRQADDLVEIGPGAGRDGGRLVLQGPISKLLREADDAAREASPTLKVLSAPAPQPPLDREPWPDDRWLTLRGVRLRNLAAVGARFAIDGLTVVTGVCGAGKSTLVIDCLAPAVAGELGVGVVEAIEGHESIAGVIAVDQAPIGRNPRSNPATYTKLLDPIRELFAQRPAARAAGWNAGRFSFNTAGGRCEACEGAGVRLVGLHFLGNVQSTCERCGGRRFDDETLAVEWKGHTIYDVLALEVREAQALFADEAKIRPALDTLADLGLGYLQLGQPATTLSGGEAQRVKLATALARAGKRPGLLILDEPTIGLHERDVEQLCAALARLTGRGQTLVVVDNHPRLACAADHVIDLGPGAGAEGGRVVYQGPPAGLWEERSGFTGAALRGELHGTAAAARSKSTSTRDPSPRPVEPPARADDPLALRGVSTHNLRALDVDFPRRRLTAVTGVSGSGKSALAFDTLFATGQSRFLESFSSHARQLLGQRELPELDDARGLTPTIGIDNRSVTRHRRSTVGTVTGIYDLYRLLYSRLGRDAAGQRIELSSSCYSFNHESGACPGCDGLGRLPSCDPERLINHPELPLAGGAMKGSKTGEFFGDPHGQHVATLATAARWHQLDVSPAWNELAPEAQRLALHGSGDRTYDVTWKYQRQGRRGEQQLTATWPGLIALVNDEYRRKHEQARGGDVRALMHEQTCATCDGTRLAPERLGPRIAGRTIAELSASPADVALEWLDAVEAELPPEDTAILVRARPSLALRLSALIELGLGYLAPERASMTLSAGEARRVRIAAQVGAELCDVTYVLDEPTIGLHPLDTERLVRVLERLRAQGNTVVVVEHDPGVLAAADHLIELGPGAGDDGGRVIYQGRPAARPPEVGRLESSPILPRVEPPIVLEIEQARANNLQGIDLSLPLPGLTVLAGVSGAGKSSLAFEVVAASAAFGRARGCAAIEGLAALGAVHGVDQRPLGTSPQSTPASVTGLLDDLRARFARTPAAKAAGLGRASFSFLSKSGRCERCGGLGRERIAMDFMADLWTRCTTCDGHRFRPEVLRVEIDGRSIADLLEMPIASLRTALLPDDPLRAELELFETIGLGHLALGQGANTLSGGEAQRLRLVRELRCGAKQRSLFILDEPTTGLAERDVRQLLRLFARLCEQGHRLLICEHHLTAIEAAHHVIELGPGGGEQGGRLSHSGTPAQLRQADTPTGAALRSADH